MRPLPRLCPKCGQSLKDDIDVKKGPGDQYAHGVYYGADWGFWCVFRWNETSRNPDYTADNGNPIRDGEIKVPE
jgi:hypothetical protein